MPSSTMPPPVSNQAPPARPPLTFAHSVAVGDLSTSIVIRPDPADQIECHPDTVNTVSDVPFVTRSQSDTSIPLFMDVLIPRWSEMPHPVVVYIPGGGFMNSAKEAALNRRTYLVEAGFVVASVQYRTMRNAATFRDGVADIKSAIRYLRRNAPRFNIDPQRVAVWGESAGGYLAAMAGVTNGVRTFEVGNDLDQSSDVQAVIDNFGPTDITTVAADFDSETQAAYGRNNLFLPYMGGEATAAGDPVNHVKTSAPPFLIFHGSHDVLVSPSQTLRLHTALTAASGRSTRYVLEGASHGDLTFLGDLQSGLPWSSRQSVDIIVKFLRETIDGG
jgi:acetyl esterase/lipase